MSTKTKTPRRKKTRSITIIGRRWFHRGPGNTYNTAEILVNGECVHKTEQQYGYGDHYVTIAAEWLESNGYLPGREHNATNGSSEPLWQYCRRMGIVKTETVSDVGRERDL